MQEKSLEPDGKQAKVLSYRLTPSFDKFIEKPKVLTDREEHFSLELFNNQNIRQLSEKIIYIKEKKFEDYLNNVTL